MDDLLVLIEDIFEQLGRPHMRVDAEGMLALRARSWRGNVRQLRTVIEAAVIESDGNRLAIEQVLAGTSTNAQPERPSGRYDDAKEDFDRRFYTPLYMRFDGNVSKIAKAAGKQRAAVLSALRALGLRSDDGASSKA